MLEIGKIGRIKSRTNKKRYNLGFSAGSKTCGRGQKGQLSRSGSSHPYVGFEGGQTPLFRRVPKRGFNNIWRVEYVPLNLSVLNTFEEGSEITPELLIEKGWLHQRGKVKVLGGGELTKKLTVKAHKFSQSAEAKIKSAGGTVEVVSA